MLIIPKGKLYLARALFWGGLAIAIVGGFVASDIGYFLIGMALGFLGAWLLDRIYTCPDCGYRLLKANGMTVSLKEKCPEQCPNCKTPITIEKK